VSYGSGIPEEGEKPEKPLLSEGLSVLDGPEDHERVP